MGPEELDAAFTALAHDGVQGVIVIGDPILFAHRERIAGLGLKMRLPTMFQEADYAAAGGLVAYGPSVADLFREAATYVDKILAGARPSDLPVRPVTKNRLVVNVDTASRLGIEVPQAALARARVVGSTGSVPMRPAAGPR